MDFQLPWQDGFRAQMAVPSEKMEALFTEVENSSLSL